MGPFTALHSSAGTISDHSVFYCCVNHSRFMFWFSSLTSTSADMIHDYYIYLLCWHQQLCILMSAHDLYFVSRKSYSYSVNPSRYDYLGLLFCWHQQIWVLIPESYICFVNLSRYDIWLLVLTTFFIIKRFGTLLCSGDLNSPNCINHASNDMSCALITNKW